MVKGNRKGNNGGDRLAAMKTASSKLSSSTSSSTPRHEPVAVFFSQMEAADCPHCLCPPTLVAALETGVPVFAMVDLVVVLPLCCVSKPLPRLCRSEGLHLDPWSTFATPPPPPPHILHIHTTSIDLLYHQPSRGLSGVQGLTPGGRSLCHCGRTRLHLLRQHASQTHHSSPPLAPSPERCPTGGLAVAARRLCHHSLLRKKRIEKERRYETDEWTCGQTCLL